MKQHFDEHCQNIGVQIHKAVKELDSPSSPTVQTFAILKRSLEQDEELFGAVKDLVEHTIEMTEDNDE